MGFGEFLGKRADDMIELGLAHAAVVGAAVNIATVIGVALDALTFQHERAREIALAVTGSFLTIPPFALFNLLLGPLGLGSPTVLLALLLYGLLRVASNANTTLLH